MPTGCLHKTAGSPQDLYIIHNTECIAGQRRKPNSHGAIDEMSHRAPSSRQHTGKDGHDKGGREWKGRRREARGEGAGFIDYVWHISATLF